MIALALTLLAWTTIGVAQTHPCDVVPASNPQWTSPLIAGFCHYGKDTNGANVTVTAFQVAIDGQLKFDNLMNALGPPNAAGQSYFETPSFAVPIGNHTATFSVYVSGLGYSTVVSFPFGVVGTLSSLPSAPTRQRIRK
jgi:hypothetical protein